MANPVHVKNDLLRWLLVAIGWVAVVAGVIGLFLPLVPTVPLLLLAAACFARSSERFHSWLVEHDHLGPLVRDYLSGKCIPQKAKWMAVGMVWVTVPTSAFLFVPVFWVKLLLLAIAAGVTMYLFRLPTSPPGNGPKGGSDNPS